jgi:preprotein translocase subunit SecG
MFILLIVVHVLVALALILIVLLQVGKGQSIGAAFGGASSSQTIFGSRGPATFLSHLTTVAAAVFMVTSLSLAYLSAHRGQSSVIMDQAPAATGQPAVPAPPIAPEEAPPVGNVPAPEAQEETTQ